ncbi:hypothetical protein GCM10010441_69170 [Kitasatospora paracochleata]|uniref:Uncharacterized protein n=1 Tax=Kitasatospora paracochleata TaxID=58354 RepID=A0ABT1J8B0_9ACTN|nr:hypothetical protein [Kitasatospora paracochleata]MCP2313675.1 hypothetical protein [Kitasatospora paracochleata]
MSTQRAAFAAAARRRTVLQWAALALLFLLGIAELLGGGGWPGSARAAGPATGRISVEQLAGRIGCRAEITADTADLRQGLCTSSGEEVWIATFPTAPAQQAWTSQAEDYGGSYLVGDGWVVVLSDTTADRLHGLLGGEILAGVDHTGMDHSGAGHTGPDRSAAPAQSG